MANRLARQLTCECGDGLCPGNHGAPNPRLCGKPARRRDTLYRVDMEDYTGTVMCEVCRDDAMASGLFRMA